MTEKTNELKKLKEWKSKHIHSHKKLLGWQRKIEADLNKVWESIRGLTNEIYRVEGQQQFFRDIIQHVKDFRFDLYSQSKLDESVENKTI